MTTNVNRAHSETMLRAGRQAGLGWAGLAIASYISWSGICKI